MSPSVLIVEDEMTLQRVYKLVLEAEGFDVRTADNGKLALKKIKQNAPDIVLLDLFMPVMGGKEFLETIDLSKYPRMQIIANTNVSDKATESEILSLGAKKFVLKASMGPQDLVALIQEMTAAGR